MSPNWHDYEKQVEQHIRDGAQGPVEIVHDAKLVGHISGVERQIDVLVTGSFAGLTTATMAVDCKCFSRNVNVKDVEAFIGMLEDLDIRLGMLVTTKGFSKAAIARATWIERAVVPLVDVSFFGDTSYWLLRAGEQGRYIGDLYGMEPYVGSHWRVKFATGVRDDDEDYDEDILWSESALEESWASPIDGPRRLATLLIRHRFGRNPEPEEVTALALAIEDNIDVGQGFEISTSTVDEWLVDFASAADDA